MYLAQVPSKLRPINFARQLTLNSGKSVPLIVNHGRSTRDSDQVRDVGKFKLMKGLKGLYLYIVRPIVDRTLITIIGAIGINTTLCHRHVYYLENLWF